MGVVLGGELFREGLELLGDVLHALAVALDGGAQFFLHLRELAHQVLVGVGLAHAHGGGEISLAQARDAGASYVIVGHAERRDMGETNDDTRKKVAAAFALKMTPILCVGERERTASGEHFNLVKEQLRAGCADVAPAQVGRVIVTYEPLWTIGGSKTMSPRDMHEMAIFIRKSVVDLKGESGMSIKILYGGSVDETNAGVMLRRGDVHGLLVGRASEDAAKFSALLQAIEHVS